MPRITEIFFSIQGESTHVGRPCVFVRLTACDLRCRWCDTEYAFTEGKPLSFLEVLNKIRSYDCRLVEITGGEPLLQNETPDLCRALLDEGYEVLVETGGHRDISILPEGVKTILDIKCPGSGEHERNDWDNLARLGPGDEIKFVIANRSDFDWALDIVDTHGLTQKAPVHFSPVFGELPYPELSEWILASGTAVRFQPQIHKHIWGPAARGV